MRKMTQHRSNMTPRASKREGFYFGWRSPRWPVWLPKHQYISPCEILFNTREEDPRALRPQRGDRRILFGFRHVPLEGVSVEYNGVQWSTANYVELALNFNTSRLNVTSSCKQKVGLEASQTLENPAGGPPKSSREASRTATSVASAL